MQNKTIKISAADSRTWPDLAEIFRNRSLIMMLASRQIRGRYAQTVLGIFWTLVQPVTYMIVLNLFFSIIARFSSGSVPYPLFLLSGLLIHQFFSRAISDGAASLQNNEALLGKVFLPRLIFPLVAITIASVDLAIVFTFFFLLVFIYGFALAPKVVLVIAVLGILYVLAVGSAITFAALGTKYRDLRMALPTVVQLLFFASPILYDVTVIPEKYRLIWGLNPLVGLIPALRWCVFPDYPFPDMRLLAMSCTIAVILLIGGLYYFQKVERQLADAL